MSSEPPDSEPPDSKEYRGVEANKHNIASGVLIVQLDELLLREPKRHVEEIITELLRGFISYYMAKTFVVNDNILGLYCYDGKRYVECDTLASEYLHRNYDAYALDKHNIRYVSMEKEFRARLRASTIYPLITNKLMISFNNGVLDWSELLNGNLMNAFMSHDPELVVFNHINHNLRFDLLSKSLVGLEKYTLPLGSEKIHEIASSLCPKTLKAFKEWVGDKWILLYEIIGFTLYPKYDIHKAIMLVGEGSNGKSTYLRLVEKILGKENTVSISLQELTDESNRFAIASLHNKLANIYPDLPNKPLGSTGRFKILTGEDMISADRKFRDRITFVNYAKLLFSANQLPPVTDMTTAFWRRWLVIEFPNQFPPNPNFFYETFTEQEIEGVIVVSILAFRDAFYRRKFSFEETESDYKELWLKNTNTVYAFIKDMTIQDTESRIETNELYQLYVKYCSENDLEPVTKRTFTIELERLGIKKVVIHGRHYYKGVKPKTPEETPEETEVGELG